MVIWLHAALVGDDSNTVAALAKVDGNGACIVTDPAFHGRVFAGDKADLRGTIDVEKNRIGGPDPEFDEEFRPRAPDCVDIGYRPAKKPATTSAEQR